MTVKLTKSGKPDTRGVRYDHRGIRVGFVPPDKKAEVAAKAAAAEDREIEAQLQLLRRQKMAIDARESLLTFTQFTMPDPAAVNDVTRSRYDAEKFHVEIAKVLEAVERGEITQLIFCMPPRHGKTELATKRFAAWYHGKHPDHDIGVASYSDTMAEDFGADVRSIMGTPQYKQTFPTFRLRRGGAAKGNIQTERGGRAVFVGRGGALTGRGGHLLLGDDLFKDHEEARSQAVRDATWNWFTKVFMTRRMGKKLVVLTMNCWHADDVIGRLTDLENPNYNAVEAAKWKIIRLPAIAEEDDPLGRKPGDVLWPERYDRDFLESQMRLDPLGFATQYQQRPSVADGILFRRETIQFYTPELLPSDLRIYASSDHAVSTAQRRDYTVMLTVGLDKQQNIYLLDCFWERAATDKVVEAMLQMARDRKPLLWWAERGHISKSIGPFLRKRMAETNTFFTVREVTPVGDKEQRAQSISARISLGKVYLPKHAIWTERAVNQMLSFPNGTHDDFVDALAYIGLGLQSQFGAAVEAPKKDAPPKYGTLPWVKWISRFDARKADAAHGGF